MGKCISLNMFLYIKIARDMEAECSFILRKIWLNKSLVFLTFFAAIYQSLRDVHLSFVRRDISSFCRLLMIISKKII